MTTQDKMSRISLMKAMIASLRIAAQSASGNRGNANGAIEPGQVLVSNMLAAFALELALKMFFTVWYDKDVRGHDLSELFNDLPPKMQADIAAQYEPAVDTLGPIFVYGFMTGPTAPAPPEGTGTGYRYSTTSEFFESCAKLFVTSRYFFEGVSDQGWTFIDHPITHMCRMIDILSTLFEDYQANGWNR